MLRPSATTRFVAGRAVSDCGDWLTTVAVAVALYTLTRSLAAPALAILFRVAPRPVGTLAGGHLADRLGPVPTLVALNVFRAAVTGALAVALDVEAVPLVLALLALTQAAGGAAQPAGQAAIPRLVPAAGVARLNAAVGTVDSAALVAGPGIAAGLLGLLGTGSATWLVVADALSFLVLAAILIGLPRLGRIHTGEREECGASPWAGIRLVLRRPFLRQLALAQLGIFATITCLQAILPAAALQRFGSASAAGWMYAAIGAGNVLGAVVLLRTRHRGLGARTMALLTLGELVPLGAFALAGSAWIDIGLAGLSGLASAPYEILAMTEMARIVSSHRLGQASGAVWLFGYVGMLGGGLLAAVVAPRLGWVPTLLLVWGGGTAVLVAGWLRPRRGTLTALIGRPQMEAGHRPEQESVRAGAAAPQHS
ncbi:MAG: MFS transporter [Candidatus Dormibacteria bacterium]|jgi:MFS family permease